jgi:hypothetical protein
MQEFVAATTKQHEVGVFVFPRLEPIPVDPVMDVKHSVERGVFSAFVAYGSVVVRSPADVGGSELQPPLVFEFFCVGHGNKKLKPTHPCTRTVIRRMDRLEPLIVFALFTVLNAGVQSAVMGIGGLLGGVKQVFAAHR